MTNVLTLISTANSEAISDDIKDKFENKTKSTSSKWLSKHVALDLYFEGSLDNISDDLLNELKTENFDFAFQKISTRKKKMLIADMDSTIITVECIDELADYLGIKEKVSKITQAAMQGDIDFKGALRERVSLLKGLKIEELEKVYKERIKLTPGAMTLVKTMNAHGAFTILVSGGFTYFSEKIAKLTDFKVNRANILLHKNGKLTGEVGEPIVDADTKINSLREFQKTLGLSDIEIIAVGDGANDIPMLVGAGLGVGYHAFPKAAAASDVVIHHGDLTALLYLQGYSLSDFVDA